VKSTGTSHLVIGKGQVKLTSETAIKAKDQESKNTSIIEKQMSDLQVNNQVEVNNVFFTFELLALVFMYLNLTYTINVEVKIISQ
jgi:hypothetical protein